ncbi:WSSV190 [White spot syndrome virus]|uniref:WSSV190 n=1 Tax=White spot syndrome virus TaxID=342409 RepID=A0A2I6SBU3_9VIRU|nr:WSSV190 [White spot syndrome virus]
MTVPEMVRNVSGIWPTDFWTAISGTAVNGRHHPDRAFQEGVFTLLLGQNF